MTASGTIAALQKRGKDLRRVAEDADGERLSCSLCFFGAFHGLVQVVDAFVEVAVGDTAFDPVGINLDAQGYSPVHGDGQRLGAAHAAEAGGEADAALQRSAEA